MKLSLFLVSFVWSVSTIADPSFDCTKAQSKAENSICESEALASLDLKIAKAYKQSLLNSSNTSLEKARQWVWLKETRDKCDDAECLERVMGERLALLSPPPVVVETRHYRENSYKSPPLVAEPLPTVEPVTPKPEVVASPPIQVASAPAWTPKETQRASVNQTKPFFSETVIFWIVVGFVATMFLTAIGIKKHANYFCNWFDFVISTGMTLLIIGYLPNIYVALAVVVVFHIIIGSAINDFSFTKGLISSIGRCSGIFVLLGVILASLIFIFTKTKSSSIGGRINNGEDPMQAIENDRKDNHRQMFGYAVGAGATGGVLYTIDSYFINNAEKTGQSG